MRIDEFSKEELEKLSKAFSKSPLMIKKRDEDKLKKNG